MKLNKNGEHLTTAPLSEGAARPSQSPPEFFRLPKAGGDPYFGLGRSYYYEGERLGYWHLVRLRQRGKLRGVTLVPYDVIAAFIRKQGGCNPGTPGSAHKAGYARKQECSDKSPTVSKAGQGGTITGSR